jgi:peptidoglycan/LPS O-acetylase OafA/YrhL
MITVSPATLPPPPVRTGTLYFPGLNGLRAIAALAVLVSHINMGLMEFKLPNLPTLDLAGFGVTIFFALSGFLITYLLLTERADTGRIDVRKFYLRRILRIWPLYYLYLAVAVALPYVFSGTAPGTDLFYFLFFAPNVPFVFGTSLPYLAHYWSLGVEEQFYSFWPWVVKKFKHPVYFFGGFVCLWVGLKAGASLVWGGYSVPYTFLYVIRFDCMAIGALGAWVLYQRQAWVLQLLVNRVAEAVAWAVIGLVAVNRFHLLSIIDHEIIAGVTVVLILNQGGARRPLLNLETRLLDFLGRISFGLYVYHPVVIFLLSLCLGPVLPEAHWPRMAAVYAAIIGTTVAVAYLSLTCFEKPFLALKEKFAVVKSTNRQRLA